MFEIFKFLSDCYRTVSYSWKIVIDDNDVAESDADAPGE